MPKFHIHHVLLVFLGGALAGILFVALGVYFISASSQPAHATTVAVPNSLATTGDVRLSSVPTYPSNPTLIPPTSPAPFPTIVGEMLLANGKVGSETIPYGTNVALEWRVQGSTTVAGPCTVSWDKTNTRDTSGKDFFAGLTQTTVYSITCASATYGGSVSAQVTVNVRPQGASPLSVGIKANDTDGSITVPYWSPVTLAWTANYPDALTGCSYSHTSPYSDYNPRDVGVPGNETTYFSTAGSYVYTFSCSGLAGEVAKANVTVVVQPETNPIKVNLQINGSHDPLVIPYDPNRGLNDAVPITLTWTSNYPDLICYGDGGTGQDKWMGNDNKTSSGQFVTQVTIANHGAYFYPYAIKCKGRGETTSDSVPISFTAAPPTVYKVTLSGNGQSGTMTVAPGTNILLKWASNYMNGSVCQASGDWSGGQDFNGQKFTGALYSNKIYTIKCGASNFSSWDSQDTLTVYVSNSAPTPTPTPAPAPTPVPSPTPAPMGSVLGCDQTATAVVNAAGGCSNVDSNKYGNVYAACCKKVTKTTILQMLNNDLSDGVISSSEKSALLDALNRYLSL